MNTKQQDIQSLQEQLQLHQNTNSDIGMIVYYYTIYSIHNIVVKKYIIYTSFTLVSIFVTTYSHRNACECSVTDDVLSRAEDCTFPDVV